MICSSFYFILIKFCQAGAPASSTQALHTHSQSSTSPMTTPDCSWTFDNMTSCNWLRPRCRQKHQSYTYRQKRPLNCAVDRMGTPLVPISLSPVHTWLCWFDTNGTSAEMNLCRTPTNDPATVVPEFVYNFGRIPVRESKRGKKENEINMIYAWDMRHAPLGQRMQ